MHMFRIYHHTNIRPYSMNYSCLQALAQLVGEWLGFGKPPSRELDSRLAKKISSFALCLKRSWGPIFPTGNRPLCTDGVLSQRFGDFLDLCEKVFLVKFFSLISLLMYMWSLSWFFPFFCLRQYSFTCWVLLFTCGLMCPSILSSSSCVRASVDADLPASCWCGGHRNKAMLTMVK